MTYAQVMKELKSMGTSQNRKVYGRHGVGRNMFGVSFANLNLLKKRIKTNHDLAVKLWDSGNHDARILATMIADPAEINSSTLDAWVRTLDNYVITDAFSALVGSTPHARKKAEKWMRSKHEWVGRSGWSVLCRVASSDEDLNDEYFVPYLVTIESDIHMSKNRVRDAMNMAIINIGLRSAAMEKKAVAAAKRIGKVDVDHGETSCQTPDAIEYIKKTKAYRAKKTSKAKSKSR
jgi:3-methyladenine DNA glycosylase AlkD